MYPEHEKLQSRRTEHEVIVDFINYLEETGRSIKEPNGQRFDLPLYRDVRPEKIIAEYLDIDESKLEAEKRHMLQAYQK